MKSEPNLFWGFLRSGWVGGGLRFGREPEDEVEVIQRKITKLRLAPAQCMNITVHLETVSSATGRLERYKQIERKETNMLALWCRHGERLRGWGTGGFATLLPTRETRTETMLMYGYIGAEVLCLGCYGDVTTHLPRNGG